MAGTGQRRLVVFGATGHLGREVIEGLAESGWPIAEIVGVASPESAGVDFEFRGESFDVVTAWPTLKGRDLVLVCTPASVALEVVREALRAEVPCIDCTGSLVGQPDVPMPVKAAELGPDAIELGSAPLLALASPTTIAWTPIVDALAQRVPVRRIVATVLCSASAWGRRGVASLSEESIALFNQSEAPETGPAGQGVAFDVIPRGAIDETRVASELARLFGEELGLALSSVQVPTFVGEGASIAIELASPLDRESLELLLTSLPGITRVAEGPGSRGLTVVKAVEDVAEGTGEIAGPTLRDSAGSKEVLVGRLRADPSLPAGQGWCLWVSMDPIGLAAGHAVRLAGRRLGFA